MGINSMHEMRTAIMQRSPGETITGIARGLDKWELGRLANCCQQVYGASPSDTLRRIQLV